MVVPRTSNEVCRFVSVTVMRPAKYLMRLLRNRLLELFFFFVSAVWPDLPVREGVQCDVWTTVPSRFVNLDVCIAAAGRTPAQLRAPLMWKKKPVLLLEMSSMWSD